MPPDLTSIADPRFVVLAWAAGLGLASGSIAAASIVGPGFTWLTGGLAAVMSLGGVFAEDAWWGRAGILLLLVGLVWAREPRRSGVAQLAGSVCIAVQSAVFGGWIPAITATVALGGVTGEMALGHWYLIDPRLPRWALRVLAVAGIIGLVADGAALGLSGLPAGGATIAFWVLLGTSVLLMTGVIGALEYPAYSGVMAATGLSYLAVLTTLGAVFLGRALIAGMGPLDI